MCQTTIHFDMHLEPIRENGDMSGVTKPVSQRRIKLNRGENGSAVRRYDAVIGCVSAEIASDRLS